ncbi:tetratricopeptide repeat protein [Polyangium sorediatum]|uniref:Tetratricopeptide repeat protein n=1 Tax=Polyangium sorediatum TaxID=889274 RepID=A0ABT6P114_9BACT|nr:tetratricopeptide repeat protein [Polyangium sorediatum]MDI1434258.1 tetratricopeptide repeat protein [Polyangium sorediatum]
MRALHLIGLRTATGEKVRLYPADASPLFLPSWLVESDREILLAFYQQILAEDTLRRVEVEWYRSVVDADREFLRNLRERHGSDEYLVVVKVRRPDVDLNDVLAQPELQGLQHVAIASDCPVAHESLGKLGEMGRLVQTTADEIYEEMVRDFGLREDGVQLVEPLVQTLLNPILIIETYNALLDVHAENVARENQRDAIYLRILGRLLDTMPGGEVVALVALALRGEEGLAAAIDEPERTSVFASLRGRMLVRDQKVIRWARFLSEEFVRELLRERVQRLAYPRTRPAHGARRVVKWLDPVAPPVAKDHLRAEVLAILGWLSEGQLGRARTELQALESRLDEPGVTMETRSLYWLVAAHILRQEGRWAEAEPLFREALRLQEEGGVGANARGVTIDGLARGLRDNGCWAEAEPMFLEALRLKREGAASPKSLAMTLRAYSEGLRAHGRHEEALRLEVEAELAEASTRIAEISAQATTREAPEPDDSDRGD